ncbi:hypothetical protein ZWY2020_025271 [Hordeum vulgare]|nr:hypothetical protein ZWY2020_025271 [Hordeum vulgare]
MSSTAAGGKPSRSASALVADTATGSHHFTVDLYSRTKGIPTGECLMSCPFTVGGHRWLVLYYPNGDQAENAGYISLRLMLAENTYKAVRAQHQFRFAGEPENQALPLAAEPLNNFAGFARWGNSKFIRVEALEKSKHLRGDSFAVRCDLIVVSDFRAVETPAPAPPAFVTVPPSDLHLHLGSLLLAEKGTDVVFEAGGETFAAHRCLIAARSPVFSAELFGEMKESVDTSAVVKIDDMDAQVFNALLYFVYTDTLPETKREEAGEDAMSQHLLVAADRYNLDRLKLICEDKLCRCIQVSTVATILVLAEQHHCSGLKKACFDFLSSQANLKAAMASDGFEHLSQSCPAIMKELISMLSALVP